MSTVISLPALEARALLNRHLREFFNQRRVLEVETPVLSALSQTPLTFCSADQALFLQPHHRQAMQDLVGAGSGAIYQIAKAFRIDEIDRRHQREFSLLEWLDSSWSPDQAIIDLTTLFAAVFAGEVLPEIRSYAQAFQQRLGFDPTTLPAADLKLQARRLGLTMPLGDDRQAWLDALFTHFIEPTLGIETPLYLSELIHEQQDELGTPWLHVYMEGIKVGSILYIRHSESREQASATIYSIALGLDRLLMVMMESRRVTQVLSWREA